MSTAEGKFAELSGGKSPKDYLSPESQKKLEASKAEVKQMLETFKAPEFAALTALTLSSIIGEAVASGFIQKDEIEKIADVAKKTAQTSSLMATEAADNFYAQQTVAVGQTNEA